MSVKCAASGAPGRLREHDDATLSHPYHGEGFVETTALPLSFAAIPAPLATIGSCQREA
jgi:hypothetical protein